MADREQWPIRYYQPDAAFLAHSRNGSFEITLARCWDDDDTTPKLLAR